MVQILPPRTNIGSDIGQALGAGVAQGASQVTQPAIQQGMLNRVFDQLQNKPASSPVDLAKQLAMIGAISPQAADIVKPYLMSQMKQVGRQGGQPANMPNPTSSSFGGGAPSVPPQASQKMSGAEPQQAMPQGQAAPAALEGSQAFNPSAAAPTGGLLPDVLTPDQMSQKAESLVPYGYTHEEAQKQVAYDNSLASAQRAAAEDKAAQAGITAKEIPEFLQVGKKFSHLRNLDDWVRATQESYNEYKTLKTQLDKAFVPGLLRGIKEKGPFRVKGPILGEMAKPGAYREEALGRLSNTSRRMADMGFESTVRNKLKSEHLSDTEIEQVLHPSKEAISKLTAFPNSKKIPEEKRQERLADFFQKNVDGDTSLLVLRDKLSGEGGKGYDWKEIGPAIQEAQNKGLKLTPRQMNELSTVEMQAPIQSLSEIFRDYTTWIDFLRGNK